MESACLELGPGDVEPLIISDFTNDKKVDIRHGIFAV
jgi:hypothetical protein